MKPVFALFMHIGLLRAGLHMHYGDELSMLQEMVVRQGTWHAYSMFGWIDRDEISHNPFINADNYDKVYIKDLKFNSEKAIEQLFFYF